MASLRKESDRGRTGWRLQLRHNRKRRSLWLGDISKRRADGIARHVGELVSADESNTAPDPATRKWANELQGRLRKTLERWDLIEPRAAVTTASDSRMCLAFFRLHIASRSDWSPITKNNYTQAVDWFERRLGADRPLSSITPAWIEDWHRWMKHPGRLAEATSNKHTKRIRTLFGEAIKARLLDVNPGAGYRVGGECNNSRDHYIPRGDAAKVLKECDVEWSVIFGLTRFAGLRCPSEVTGLLWSDIDWAENRLRVDSTKTGLRFTPISPSLRPLLDAAWDAAPSGAKYVIGRHRDSESNLRTQFTRIVERAGLAAWAKPFVNCRASARTDWEETFPSHVVDAWLGHSTKIARKHYLRLTEEHWHRAVNEAEPGGVRGGVISARQPVPVDASKARNPSKTRTLTTVGDGGRSTRHPRQDSNLRHQL
ncbi:tyrosine-type recombinase/integrase [Roseiconus lacunae]|uniref:tyrosine-type recombinase/integrase n=1 Tax=Roseiconus lacunae TaxID=2605694 RepID=UPI003314D37D